MISSDFSELLKAFDGHGVRYLIVGGHAVMYYTEPRYTKDLDVWVEAEPRNAVKVFDALAEFGAPLAEMTADDFAHEGFFYQLGRPPLRVDVLTSIDGVRFSDAWPRREQAVFGDRVVALISRADLIANKRAVGRHIDLHDAELLEQAANERRPAKD